ALASELPLEEGRRPEALDLDRSVGSGLERAVELGHSRQLVGPDERAECQRSLVGGGVDRVEVAALPLHHVRRAVQRRGCLERMREADMRAGVSPGALAGLVSIPVPAQVEAGAGADLEDAEWLPRPVGHLEESAEQGRAPADLVALAAACEQGPDSVAARCERVAEDRPGRGCVSVTAGRG